MLRLLSPEPDFLSDKERHTQAEYKERMRPPREVNQVSILCITITFLVYVVYYYYKYLWYICTIDIIFLINLYVLNIIIPSSISRNLREDQRPALLKEERKVW